MREKGSTSHQAIKLVADAINKPVRSSLVDDFDTVGNDCNAMIHWYMGAIPLAKVGLSGTFAQEADDHGVVDCQCIDGKGRSWRWETTGGVWRR